MYRRKLTLHITDLCCHGCSICCNRTNGRPPSVMPFDALTSHIDSFAAGGEGGIIGMTGGEVFLYRNRGRDLSDIAAYIADRHFSGELMISLQTGGFSPSIPRYRELAAEVFSHGLRMELATSFNLFRPKPEASLAETVRIAQKYAGGLTVNVVIDRDNAGRTVDALFMALRGCMKTSIPAEIRQAAVSGTSTEKWLRGIKFKTASGFWMYINFAPLQAVGAAAGDAAAFPTEEETQSYPWQRMVRADGRIFRSDQVMNLSA